MYILSVKYTEYPHPGIRDKNKIGFSIPLHTLISVQETDCRKLVTLISGSFFKLDRCVFCIANVLHEEHPDILLINIRKCAFGITISNVHANFRADFLLDDTYPVPSPVFLLEYCILF